MNIPLDPKCENDDENISSQARFLHNADSDWARLLSRIFVWYSEGGVAAVLVWM